MAKIYGNRGPNYRSKGGAIGVGAESFVLGGKYVSVTGKVGEVVVLDITQAPTAGEIGIAVQASSAVTLHYTLEHPATAKSLEPAVQANVLWGSKQDLTTTDVVMSSAQIFTALRITFTTAATVYLYGR